MGKFLHSNHVMGTENMEILKVVIADDEVRICQLIQALIDWDSMGMKVVGIAHNGEEACEMVRQTQPDILITDIRMPGCSGLELVKRVKELDSALEVIIISGYAHFEYAQQAISYGVGHYLLKPVNKGELTATLQKLQKKIGERKESELNHQELVNKAKRDDDHTGKSDRPAAGSAGYAGFTGHIDEHLSSESKTGSVPGVLCKSGLWKKDHFWRQNGWNNRSGWRTRDQLHFQ